MRWIVLALLLTACKSGTQEIADSASAIGDKVQAANRSAEKVSFAAIRQSEEVSLVQLDLMASPPDIESARGRLDSIGSDAEVIRTEAEQIMLLTNEISVETQDIVGSLPSVKDVTPWWSGFLTYLAVAAILIAAGFILMNTGIGHAMGALLTRLIPKRRSKQ